MYSRICPLSACACAIPVGTKAGLSAKSLAPLQFSLNTPDIPTLCTSNVGQVGVIPLTVMSGLYLHGRVLWYYATVTRLPIKQQCMYSLCQEFLHHKIKNSLNYKRRMYPPVASRNPIITAKSVLAESRLPQEHGQGVAPRG